MIYAECIRDLPNKKRHHKTNLCYVDEYLFRYKLVG